MPHGIISMEKDLPYFKLIIWSNGINKEAQFWIVGWFSMIVLDSITKPIH
jgi:hypothetical protein